MVGGGENALKILAAHKKITLLYRSHGSDASGCRKKNTKNKIIFSKVFLSIPAYLVRAFGGVIRKRI